MQIFVLFFIQADDSPYFTTDLRADVQRLDIKDYGLYGLSPSDPGPMVVCNQCSHVMAPEGVARHVKKVHGAKLLSMYKVRPMDGSTISSSGNSSSSSSSSSGIAKSTTMTPPSAATLAAAFSNRLNVSRSSPTLLSAKNTATHGASDVMLTKDDSIDNMLGIALNANLNQMNQVHNSQSAYASSTSSNSSISSSSNSSSSYVKSSTIQEQYERFDSMNFIFHLLQIVNMIRKSIVVWLLAWAGPVHAHSHVKPIKYR